MFEIRILKFGLVLIGLAYVLCYYNCAFTLETSRTKQNLYLSGEEIEQEIVVSKCSTDIELSLFLLSYVSFSRKLRIMLL